MKDVPAKKSDDKCREHENNYDCSSNNSCSRKKFQSNLNQNLNLKPFVLLFAFFSSILPVGVLTPAQINYAFAQVDPSSIIENDKHDKDNIQYSFSTAKSFSKIQDVFTSLASIANENVTAFENQSGIQSNAAASSQIGAQSRGEVHGDFNGDGTDDLAIGVPSEDVDSATTGEMVSDAGAVHIIYGASSGLSATTPIKNQIWTQDSGSVEDSSEPDDRFGWSLASGDFNGDGRDDLAIGVPFEGVVSSGDVAGAVNVIYGSSSGLSATTVPDQFWTQNSGAVEDSSEPGDRFGWSLTAGNFNAGGRDDLAIGVPNEEVVSSGDVAGAVNVIYGSSSGLSATTVPDQFWTQDSGAVEDSSELEDHFGVSLASGDFNGDGRDDLVIGVPWESVVSSGDVAGAVNVIYGSSSGLSATTVPDQFWTQDSGAVEDSSESGDLFGWSLASGDFNGDSRDDLAIGVPLEGVGSPSVGGAGAVNVIYGSSSGLSATARLPDKFLTQNYPNIEDSSESGDLFGWSLASDDFNGDGRNDLAIGVPLEGVGSPSVGGAGAVNVIYGGSVGLSPTQSSLFDQFFSQASPNMGLAPDPDDNFGFSLG
jgi:hypothetical protein